MAGRADLKIVMDRAGPGREFENVMGWAGPDRTRLRV